ncbi:PspC domain-containing protein [Flavobacterium sp. UMI-01]|uniref:PspC domain-containing protein n=1 Tax=Flavobacterium sp. UMI-01 TaxID=1441053 RepID=UPI001C7D6C90|nr:PspC domain-containing protein [Flavobacterium sp. UMI-01]GIZ10300.1 hypothetical protein FUMI01_30240 [Flavobacterium sp. UMI-01]
MNKTVNINLGGFLFHIDEDAYQKLNRYFEAIKRSLNHSEGQDEIIKDIEFRIAELFQERQINNKQIIGLEDVDTIISVMGQPEDYIIEDDFAPSRTTPLDATIGSKKLYRDTENNLIGGVASGLSYYFGIDVVWIRVLLTLLVIGAFGIGIIAYIILWVVTPVAKTTSEKLEMKGEPVTISNIEKKVKEEFETVSQKLKNVDYDKFGNQIKKTSEKVGTNLSSFILAIFQVFAKILGILLIIIGISTILALLVGVFTLGTNFFIEFPWQGLIEAQNFTDYPLWSFGILLFLTAGIPFFFLTLLGFKLLAPQKKSIGNITKYTLIAIWILALAIAISIGIKQLSVFTNEGRVIQKDQLTLQPSDTLLIKFKYNSFYTNDIHNYTNFKITQDSSNTSVIYSNAVQFKIKNTDENQAYIQVEKIAKGKNPIEAKENAERIQFHYNIEGNQLLFDNYWLTELKNKFRNQQVKINIFLPKETLFKIDQSARTHNYSDEDYFNYQYNTDAYLYKVTPSTVLCLNCPEDENNEEEDMLENTSITINKNGIIIDQDTLITSKKEKGIIIKTK